MFIDDNKCTILVWDVGSGGSCACVGAGDIGELSVFSVQFCCELKTSLKNRMDGWIDCRQIDRYIDT